MNIMLFLVALLFSFLLFSLMQQIKKVCRGVLQRKGQK